jgi:hypothetical protein
MTDPQYAGQHELGESIQLDNAETLAGSLAEDPLDAGWVPPDRPVAVDRWGTTAEEEQAGESLEQRLAEEEPELDDPLAEEAEPRAGRLVAPDEGAHGDAESDAVASDVGVDGGGASAEEAAIHLLPE